ncbi:hypothetical protein IEO21_02216 [Rhodonia placenta]|uniref:Uncharacterized protein n=1 Tax=Rhodonia placenta TaxID=104341 RepID=A0A8H7P8D3_9APHY|nr:hypothetical protein IEO21_02216 [Postia placenta]
MSFFANTARSALGLISSALLGADITTVTYDTIVQSASLVRGSPVKSPRQVSSKANRMIMTPTGMPARLVVPAPRSVFSLTGLNNVLSKSLRVPIHRFYGWGSSISMTKTLVPSTPVPTVLNVTTSEFAGLSKVLDCASVIRAFDSQVIDLLPCTDLVLYTRCWELAKYVPLSAVLRTCLLALGDDNQYSVVDVIVWSPSPYTSRVAVLLQHFLPLTSAGVVCRALVIYTQCWDVVPYVSPYYACLKAILQLLPVRPAAASTSLVLVPASAVVKVDDPKTRALQRVLFTRLFFGNVYLELYLSVWLPRALLASSLAPATSRSRNNDWVVLTIAWKVVCQGHKCKMLPAPLATSLAASTAPSRPALRTPPKRRLLRQLILQQAEANAKVLGHVPLPPKAEPTQPKSSAVAHPHDAENLPPVDACLTIASLTPASTLDSVSPVVSPAKPSPQYRKPLLQPTRSPNKNLHSLQPNPYASRLGHQHQPSQKNQTRLCHEHQKHQDKTAKPQTYQFVPSRVSPTQNAPMYQAPPSSTAPPPFFAPSPPPPRGHYPFAQQHQQHAPPPAQSFRESYIQQRGSLPNAPTQRVPPTAPCPPGWAPPTAPTPHFAPARPHHAPRAHAPPYPFAPVPPAYMGPLPMPGPPQPMPMPMPMSMSMPASHPAPFAAPCGPFVPAPHYRPPAF